MGARKLLLSTPLIKMWATLWPSCFHASMWFLHMPLLPPVPCVGDEQNSSMTWGQQEVTRVIVEDLMA